MIAAWLVHLYTASGLVLALLATRAVIDYNYRAAFFWLWLQVVIDATDGHKPGPEYDFEAAMRGQ